MFQQWLWQGRPMWVVVFLFLFGACGGTTEEGGASKEGGGVSGKLVLTGSSTVAPLAGEIGRRFEERHPGVRVDVQTGGSSRGIADVRSGVAGIGMVSRWLKPEESDLEAYTIAMDGVCLIVHRDNPVARLTGEQVIGLYRGKIVDWKEVGGKPGPVTVVNKAEGRATLEVFLGHFGLKSEEIEADIIIGDNQQGIKTVSGNPGAIGYVSIGAADFEARRGAPLRLLPLDGVEATVENVASGRFPMSRPLNLVTVGKVPALAKKFIDFARSKEVHDLVRKQTYVPYEGNGEK